MRIQHNIMAMNSYRNYTANNQALSKNLEKLSSGYKINRAGDDAAGLAISEKMRAQITGLKTAQNNAQSGINLVQTAEGALTEVHDMLNRMVELADQSANGTYDNNTDRANLQKEFSALTSEIDRIADASNFNGIKLLDGSLGGSRSGAVGSLQTNIADTTLGTKAATVGNFTSGVITAPTTGAAATLTVGYTDANGETHAINVDYTSNATAADNATAMKTALSENETIKGLFDVSVTDGKIVLTNKSAGESAAKVTSLSSSEAATVPSGTVTPGANSKSTLGFGATAIAEGDTITVDGTTYTYAAASDPKQNQFSDLDSLNNLLKSQQGVKASIGSGIFGAASSTLNFEYDSSVSGKGLTLQIGDTSDDYNKITVQVGDMHAASLGIGASVVSIASQSSAAEAVTAINAAIDKVSGTRGDLGATQNRLEHTINNLSVMTENVQDAEANIRDVDVAEEMMDYTKNNILVQSAQAMLAQANQVPQGVLQLLQ